METVEFRNVEVLEEAVAGLLCRIAAKRVTVPSLLLQPGTAVRRSGDRGTLVIPRWLGIGLGLVWPFPETTAEPRHDPGSEARAVAEQDVAARGGVPSVSEVRQRRGPRRAVGRGRAAGQVADRGGGS